MDLIFVKIWLTRNIPTIHSNIWYSPRPGHSPRFDPKKLRESMKLNLSTEVFFTLTSWLNIKLNIKFPFNLVVVPSFTVATVLTQGRRQSEIFKPENMLAKKGLIILNLNQFRFSCDNTWQMPRLWLIFYDLVNKKEMQIPKKSEVLAYKSYCK